MSWYVFGGHRSLFFLPRGSQGGNQVVCQPCQWVPVLTEPSCQPVMEGFHVMKMVFLKNNTFDTNIFSVGS